jgi:hypothetical protein
MCTGLIALNKFAWELVHSRREGILDLRLKVCRHSSLTGQVQLLVPSHPPLTHT